MHELITQPLKITIFEVEKADRTAIAFIEIDLSSFVLEARAEINDVYISYTYCHCLLVFRMLLHPAAGQKFEDPHPDIQVCHCPVL